MHAMNKKTKLTPTPSPIAITTILQAFSTLKPHSQQGLATDARYAGDFLESSQSMIICSHKQQDQEKLTDKTRTIDVKEYLTDH